MATASRAAKPSTFGSIATSEARGSAKPGTPRSSRTPQPARIRPATPPLTPSASPSMTNSRASRARLAPSADRIEVSRARRTPRASSRLATFEQAISSSTPTAASSARSVGRMPPATESSNGVRYTPIWWFETGYCRSSAAAIADISRCACSRLTPSRSRASTWKPGWFARSSCIEVIRWRRSGVQTSTSWKSAPGGRTPTMVTGSSPICTVLPTTAGSAPNRRSHTRSEITATAGAFGPSSSSVKRRPRAARWPRTREEPRLGIAGAEHFRRTVRPFDHGAAEREVHRHLREHAVALAPVEIILIGDIEREAWAPLADPHELAGPVVGQRLQQDAVDGGEDRRVRANPEREREHGGDGETRIGGQRAESVTDIPEHVSPRRA